MLNSNTQSVKNGSNNILVGGNYTQIVNNESHIEICEFDILKVINECYEKIDLFGDDEYSVMDECNEYDFAEKEMKNQLNNLSKDYFEQVIIENFLLYFYKIDEFLKDPKNKELRKKYKIIALRLNCTLEANRNKDVCFEKLLSDVLNALSKKVEDEDVYKPSVIAVFIHYMYWNCDIGRKK